MMNFESTIHWLATRWKEAEVLLRAFPLLAQGHPLEIADIAKAAEAPVERVIQALEVGRCERDQAGRLIDLYGMTFVPTLHRLQIAEKMLFSCCALWAHVIPKLVEDTVRVESIDPVRREVVRLSISPDGIDSVDPEASAATLAAASEAEIEEGVREAFCWQVRHFVSRESAEEFAAGSPSCHAVELMQLQCAADLLHEVIWRAVNT